VLAGDRVVLVAEGAGVLALALAVFVAVVGAGLGNGANKMRPELVARSRGTSNATQAHASGAISVLLVALAVGFWVVVSVLPGNDMRGLTSTAAILTAAALTVSLARATRRG
jgi:hypothetical protein